MAGATTDGRYVGQPLRRQADRKLVTGHGSFVDDVQPDGCLHIAFARSPFAHAEIVAIDTAAAAAVPGVVAVITGAEVDNWLAPLPIHDPQFLPNRPMARRSLAIDKVLFAGDAIAAVVAESAEIAHDAAELIEVNYRELPVVTTPAAAMVSDAPRLYEAWDSNVAYHLHAGSGDIDVAMADAAWRVPLRLVVPRVASVYVEPKAILAEPDAQMNKLTVHASTQTPHGLRSQIASVLGMPEHAVRVIAPDVGGAFGTKGRHAPDYLFTSAVAHRLGRPVKWVELRGEYFHIANQGRDQVQELEAAVARDGAIIGLRVRVLVNCGAHNASTHGQRTLMMSSGAYRIPNLVTDVYGVMTNTTPTGPYRGAGRPEAAYMIERLIDEIARVTGIESLELRRRNFIPANAFPYRAATGTVYDSGDYAHALDVALARLDYPIARQDIERRRAAGEIAGIGVAVFVEPSGGGWDSAEVRVAPSGAVTVAVGVSPHGQGTDVGIAQLVADELGVSIEQVSTRHGDTDTTPQGIGTFGSRSLTLGGAAAVVASRKIVDKLRRIAAGLLEVAPDDVTYRAGVASVSGAPDRNVPFKRLASAAYNPGNLPVGVEPGLDENAFYLAENNQFPFGVHIAVVRIDRDTGRPTVERFIGVDDCGNVVNPLMVEAQVIGGLAQGFGQALWEEVVFDADGQLITGSLMDYAVPHADQLPNFELDHTTTPSPGTPHGVKGVGEAGTTGSPPAIANAVLDALLPLGVTALDMPFTAEKIWRAIREASA